MCMLEIIQIAESIRELAQLFNELNVLVIEQVFRISHIEGRVFIHTPWLHYLPNFESSTLSLGSFLEA